MKKIKNLKSIKLILLSIILSVVVSLAWSIKPVFADLEDEICEWSEGIIGCEGESNFKDLKGLYKPIDPNLIKDAEGNSIFKCVTFKECVVNYTNFFLGFLGLAAIITIIYGGYLYVLAGGEAEQTEKGKKNIIYAVTGLLIVIISYAIVNTVLVYAPKGEYDPGSGRGAPDPGQGASLVSSSGLNYVNSSGQSVQIKSQLQNTAKDLQAFITNYNVLSSDVTTSIKKLEETLANQELLNELAVNSTSRSNLINDTRTLYGKLQSNTANFSDLRESAALALQHLEIAIVKLAQIYQKRGNKGFAFILNAFAEDNDPFPGGDDDIPDDDDDPPPPPPPPPPPDDDDDDDPPPPPDDDNEEDVAQNEDEPVDTTEIENFLKMLICDLDKDYNSAYCTAARQIISDHTSAEIFQSNKSDYNEAIKGKLVEIVTLWVDNLQPYIQSGSPLFEDYQEAIIGSSGANLATIKVEDIETKTPDQLKSYGKVGNLIATSGDLEVSNQEGENALKSLFSIDQEIQKLKRVNTVLMASKTSGIAPLTIQFDATKSVDPANQSIEDSQYAWTYQNDVICTPINATPVISCVFEKAGSYVISLQITSKEPATIIPSRVFLTIQVSPPKSKILLKANNETVADFANYDNPNLNKSFFRTTLSIGKTQGITFDATGSKDAFGNDIPFYSFDFGDNSAKEEGGTKSFNHKYKKAATYKFILKIKDKSQNEDFKILEVRIEDIVASFSIKPSSGTVLTTYEFDASDSISDIAAINSWKWQIEQYTDPDGDGNFTPTPISNDDILKKSPNFDNETEAEVVQIQFKNPGKYRLTLTVKDEKGSEDNIAQDLLIKSQAPVAKFDYSFPYPDSNPGITIVDASNSYDPDPLDTIETLLFEWRIKNGKSGQDYLIQDQTKKIATITFLKTGTYDVEVEVKDNHPPEIQQKDTESQKIKIEAVLGVSMLTSGSENPAPENTQRVYTLNNQSQAKVYYKIQSPLANYFEIDFGDGETGKGDIQGGEETISHTYKQGGYQEIKLTVFDAEGNDNRADSSLIIGDGTHPIAAFITAANNVVIGESIENTNFPGIKTYNRTTNFTFDAEESKNVDGSNRKLNYSWIIKKTTGVEQCNAASIDYQTADNKKFSLKLPDFGKYYIKLTVANKDNLEQKSESYFGCIEIVSAEPTLKGLEYTAQSAKLVTPLQVQLRAVSALDPDGQIERYIWWYDVPNPQTPNKYGAHSTTQPETTLTINTLGNEGVENIFNFYVELTDNEGNIVNSKDILPTLPEITLKNGPNKTPNVSIKADRTNILKGEAINFNSEAKDPDGEISSYEWDLNGNLAFSNTADGEDACDQKSTCTFTYPKKNPQGFEVRLRVTDSLGAIATSNPLKIFVDSQTEDPVAAFTFTEPGVGLKQITLTNNSTVDNSLDPNQTKFIWDKDAREDSNGDKKTDNDKDSEDKDPTFTYREFGTYEIKLTVIDSEGNQNDVKRSVTFKGEKTSQPKALFSYKVGDYNGQTGLYEVNFNASGSITTEAASITNYYWDFDLETAAKSEEIDQALRSLSENTDQNTQNDKQKDEITPVFSFKPGNYSVKLTIVDSKNQQNSAIKTLSFNPPGTFSPKANFDFTIDNTSKRVTFNASKSQAPSGKTIKKYYYDFDLNLESGDPNFQLDGKNVNSDGLTNNDVNNHTELLSPVIENTYQNYANYEVQLTVETNTGERNSAQKSLVIQDPSKGLKPIAYLKSSDPAQENQVTGNIELSGSESCVSFDYSASAGSGNYNRYVIDQNINYDLDKNGRAHDDSDKSFIAEDQALNLCYKREWESQNTIITRLTVYDANGLSAYVDRRIDFIDPLPGELDARIQSNPLTEQGGENANKIVLYGVEGNITFNFGSSIGENLKYYFDVNVFYDSNGNNVRDDDYVPIEFNQDGTPKPLTQNYQREWGKTKARLVIEDRYGQSDSSEVEIVFEDLEQANILQIIDGKVVLTIIAFMGILGVLYHSVYKKISL